MKVAVVILNWNGREMLVKYLPRVLECSQDEAEIVVADNDSSDDSLLYLEDYSDAVRVISLDRNYGFAEGYNLALQQIDAEYYVLLNSDVEVTPHWLTPLIEFMDSHPDVAACQPKLLSVDDKGRFEYAGASGGFLDRYGYPFCRGRVFETVEQDNGQYDSPADVLWATGACMMIRSADYNAVGGLDGRFFAHCEEIDLCWRLRLMGRRICCLPESKVYHVGGGTLPKNSPYKTYLNFRNNLTMLYKNLPEDELRHVMRVRMWLDYLAAVKTLFLDRSFAGFKSIFRARREFKKWRHDFDDDRRRIQTSSVTIDIPERRRYSILWRYYVKGQKTFNSME